MEKKDLVIGRKYLHKENREVYYLGEAERGDSIVQPTDGINGIVSLKACHPELKDIIGNDRFWGYFNMHLELSEIEPKYLTVDDLVDGEIYYLTRPDSWDYGCIFKHNYKNWLRDEVGFETYNNCWAYDAFYKKDEQVLIEANQEQKDWLNNCIKANKFVPKDYVDEIPKYISCNCPDFYKVGDYVITEGYSGDYDGKVLRVNKVDEEFYYFDIFHDFCDYNSNDNFHVSNIKRLATNKEIEKANLLISKWNKDDFKVGDWVVGWHANYLNYENNAWQVLKISDNYLYANLQESHITGIRNVRKALPHEIPNQNNPGVGSEVFNIDFNEVKVGHCDTFMGMKIYGHIAYPPLQPQYKWTFRNYSPKNDGLDLSLRDEKEVNVNEIKTSNNNISKLNLSLNN